MPDGDRLSTEVSTTGDVTLPQAVRDRHGWRAGTVLEIEERPDGVLLKVSIPRPTKRLEEVAGMLKKYYSGPPKTIEEMNAGIEAEVLARHARGRY